MAIKTFTTGEVLTAADTNTYLANSGLVFVKSQTIGTAQSITTVASAFSSTYDNYKIVLAGGIGSTTQAIGFQLDGSATAYYGSTIVAAYNLTTVSSNPINNAASWTFAGVSTVDNNYLNLDVLAPNLAKTTAANGPYINAATTGVGGTFSGYHAGITQFTGFKLIVSGTMTGGTITVYGYRKA